MRSSIALSFTRFAFLMVLSASSLSVLLPSASAAQGDIISGKNAGKPVDITADSLTLRPQKNLALFKGAVDVLQGDMRLKADEMLVTYKGEVGGASKPAGVSRIDARGNLVLSLPDKKAQAQVGYYDVDKGKVVLTGKVTLQQAGNSLKGDYFVHDVASGESTISTRNEGSGAEFKKSGGRVKGYFVPKDAE